MNRLPKRFIVFVVITVFSLTGHSNESAKQDLIVMTVNGPVNSEEIGVALSHEHFLVDFSGAANVGRERYDLDEIVNAALPILKQLKELGCRTLFECTPTYIGRVPELYKRLA
ncbi:MAG: hypothetical protein JXB23_11865 [Candidatus Aminicenantes bacterium]|nr:hypothetical protein [Candidatus Aminicenantes bacterium]